jgi:hypothetical protein
MIDRGMPNAAEDWPDGVLESLRAWEQGDVVANPPYFYFADPGRPVLAATAAYANTSDGPEVILPPDDECPPFGMVTSQTCDIAEEESGHPLRPWVQLAPVLSLTDKGWRRKVRKGEGPRFLLWLPGLAGEETWVADLRIEMPVEKGWLASQERIVGFGDETQKREVGKRIAWLRGRPAFSGDFNETIYRPLFDFLDTAPEGEEDAHATLLEGLEEVGLAADSFLNPATVQLVFLSSSALNTQCLDLLQKWRDTAVEAAGESGILLQAIEARTFPSFSAAEYRRLQVIWRRGD